MLSCQDRSIWRKIWPESFTWPNTAPWCLTWQSINHRWKIGSEWLDTAYHGIPLLHYPSLHYPSLSHVHIWIGLRCMKNMLHQCSESIRKGAYVFFLHQWNAMWSGELIVVFSVISSQQDVAKGIVELQWKNRRPLSSFQPPQAEITLKLLPSPEAECQRHQMTSEDQTDETCCLMLTYVVFGSACDSCLWLWISPVLPPPSAWR